MVEQDCRMVHIAKSIKIMRWIHPPPLTRIPRKYNTAYFFGILVNGGTQLQMHKKITSNF